MADEIQLSLSISCSKNGASINASGNMSITMAGDQFISNIQIVGTSNEALQVGDVSTTGYVYVKNLDSTNYVEVFLDNANTYLVAKLFPGEFTLYKPGGTGAANLFARANTGACNCQVIALEL